VPVEMANFHPVRRQLRDPQTSQGTNNGLARHPRWTFFTSLKPNSRPSWLNAVEGFLSPKLTNGALKSVEGVFFPVGFFLGRPFRPFLQFF